MDTVTQKYYHYHFETPVGWDGEEYRVFPREESEANIDSDWRSAVSDFVVNVYDEVYGADEYGADDHDIPTIQDFYEETLLYSWAEEIDESEYLDGQNFLGLL